MRFAIFISSTMICRTVDYEAYVKMTSEVSSLFVFFVMVFIAMDMLEFLKNMNKED